MTSGFIASFEDYMKLMQEVKCFVYYTDKIKRARKDSVVELVNERTSKMASDNLFSRDAKEKSEFQLVNKSVACLEKAIETNNIVIKKLQDEVTEKDERIKEMKTGRDALQDTMMKTDKLIQEMNTILAGKCNKIDDMVREITEMELRAKNKDEELGLMKTSVEEKCRKIEQLIIELTELRFSAKKKDDLAHDLNVKIAKRDQQTAVLAWEIKDLQDSLKKKDETIRDLNSTVTEKSLHIEVLTSQIAELQRNLTEKDGRLQNLNVTLFERDQRIEGMALEMSNSQDSSRGKREILEKMKAIVDKLEQRIKVKSQEVQRLNDTISESNAQIKTLTDETHELKEKLSRSERKLLMNKQLQNTMKLLELEKLTHKTVEIECVVCKIKQDTANIAEHLTDRLSINHCQSTEQTAVAASSRTKTRTLPDHLRRIKELYKPLTHKLTAKAVAVEMYQRDAISFGELESIQSCRNQCKAAEVLLKVLLQHPVNDVPVYECFLEALKSTDQHHIFLWISYPDYKIDSAHTELIRQHYMFMVENLDVKHSGLIAKLYAKNVLNYQEKDELESSDSSSRRIERLLSMLSRKSSGQFEGFLEVLDQTGQGHIAKIIREQTNTTIAWSVVQFTTSSTPSLTRVISADDTSAVVGVTSADNRLFVLRSPSRQHIQVYDLQTFTLQQYTLKVSGLSDSWNKGMTACGVNKCLYVSDSVNATVYKVRLTVDNKIFKWPVGAGPVGLSINTACNLLVACYEDKKIQEYNTTNGSLVREIRLASSDGKYLRPWHVIEMISGQFVVSCRADADRATSGCEDDVVEIDVDGRVVFSYKNQLQSTTKQQFSWPRHLAVDKDHECILVADLYNNRTVILRRSSNRCACEFSVTSNVSGLQQPSCLHFSESQGRLFVGEMSGQRRILVYDNVTNISNSF